MQKALEKIMPVEMQGKGFPLHRKRFVNNVIFASSLAANVVLSVPAWQSLGVAKGQVFLESVLVFYLVAFSLVGFFDGFMYHGLVQTISGEVALMQPSSKAYTCTEKLVLRLRRTRNIVFMSNILAAVGLGCMVFSPTVSQRAPLILLLLFLLAIVAFWLIYASVLYQRYQYQKSNNIYSSVAFLRLSSWSLRRRRRRRWWQWRPNQGWAQTRLRQ